MEDVERIEKAAASWLDAGTDNRLIEIAKWTREIALQLAKLNKSITDELRVGR